MKKSIILTTLATLVSMTYADQRTVTFDFSNPAAYRYNKPADGAGTPLTVGCTTAEPEIYNAISWDGATYTVSDEFKAVADAESTNGGVATNAVNGMSVVKFGTASVSVEAVSSSTPKNVTETEYGVFPGWAEWYDVKWDWKNRGDILFGYIVGTGYSAVEINHEAVISYDGGDPTGVWRPAYTFYEADGSKGMPVMGLYYKFTIKKTGLLKIGVWSNKGNRQTFIVDEATKTPIKMRAEGYINGQTDANGQKKFLSTDEIQAIHDAAKVNAEGVDSAPYVIGAGNQPFWGNLIAEVEAGKTYWLFQNSSQIGFAGYEFEPNITNVIYYTSSDGKVITPHETDVFGANIVSNTYEKGQGVITFDGDVTSIGYDAFRECSGLTSITIPNSVTSIGNSAFWGCSGLTSITIPNSVTSIGSSAFRECSGLTSITILNSVTSIGAYAFRGCSGLTSIIIPNSVTSIGGSAFWGCSGLTSITIPNSVTSIGSDAYNGCSGLTSITIPNSVTSIGSSAFRRCSGLTSIEVESGNQHYDSRNDCNAIIETSTNTLISGCKNTIIPNSVTSIGRRAFSGCSGLTSITIPNSVTSIGSYAFSGCM